MSSFQQSEILFLNRNRHYGTENTYISTAQILRALKRQHKTSGMSLQYSGAGTEDVTQMKGAAGGDSRSNRRQSDGGLAAIYKAARCLHGSWDHR